MQDPLFVCLYMYCLNVITFFMTIESSVAKTKQRHISLHLHYEQILIHKMGQRIVKTVGKSEVGQSVKII